MRCFANLCRQLYYVTASELPLNCLACLDCLVFRVHLLCPSCHRDCIQLHNTFSQYRTDSCKEKEAETRRLHNCSRRSWGHPSLPYYSHLSPPSHPFSCQPVLPYLLYPLLPYSSKTYSSHPFLWFAWYYM